MHQEFLFANATLKITLEIGIFKWSAPDFFQWDPIIMTGALDYLLSEINDKYIIFEMSENKLVPFCILQFW